MAYCPELVKALQDVGPILWPQDVAEILQISERHVRILAAQGAFRIFRPEADPDEECILREELIVYLQKSI